MELLYKERLLQGPGAAAAGAAAPGAAAAGAAAPGAAAWAAAPGAAAAGAVAPGAAAAGAVAPGAAAAGAAAPGANYDAIMEAGIICLSESNYAAATVVAGRKDITGKVLAKWTCGDFWDLNKIKSS
ncbi:unnamed protein product [Closterium sp. NIES-54]